MPLARFTLTEEAYLTLREEARDDANMFGARLTLNRYVDRLALLYGSAVGTLPVLAWPEYLPPFESLTHTQLLRIVTQGGAQHGVPGGGALALDPRRLHPMNVRTRTVTYFAAVADAIHIPFRKSRDPRYPWEPGNVSRASWALEFYARDWVKLDISMRKEGVLAS